MALVIGYRTKETSTTTGVGTYSLLGTATGFQTFVAGVGNGNTTYYFAEDGTNWEFGVGTVTDGAPDTLARTTIMASSNGGAAVNWGAGTRNVVSGFPATGLALTANNLSDLANVATARTNLGLGTVAVLNVGTAANNIPQLNGSAQLPAVSGALLTNLPGEFPAATVMVFYQAAAPTGWTKLTTQNDKALRVVSGGTGGTAGGSRALSAATVGSHQLALNEIPAHTHDLTSDVVQSVTSGSNNVRQYGTGTPSAFISAASGGNGSHDHALALAYVDVILASRN